MAFCLCLFRHEPSWWQLMCGLAGMVDWSRSTSAADLTRIATSMVATLRHRGPDDEGSWVDASAGVGLGHRRLAIIDPSQHGRQPMVSASGRFVIAYNGEVYNYRELSAQLEGAGHRFAGHSDTEVMLAAFETWGVPKALERFNGMFAFGLWDQREGCIYLARDRFGEKPLYYAGVGQKLLFGSELKALCACEDFKAEIDRDALALYFRYNCIPAPYCIYKNTYKLLPASYLRITTSALDASPVRYWSLQEEALRASQRSNVRSDAQVVEELEEVLGGSVRLRMLSDAPLGAFLSGGVDSSTIVALMQKASRRARIKTFSIGVSSTSYNEAEDAKAVAQHLGTDHTELYVSPEQALEVIPALPRMYDEPFSDSSQIPTHLLSRLTRSQVTVALSGDGGDEIFGGYNRYLWLQRIWKRVGWLPMPVRKSASAALAMIPPPFIEKLGMRSRTRMAPEKLQKFAHLLSSRTSWEAYLRLASHWQNPHSLVLGAHQPTAGLAALDGKQHFSDLNSRMMCADALTFLPDDVLTKVDRASMAIGLEVRTPFLAPEVFSFAWGLPTDMKIRNGRGKWIVRQLLQRHVPREIVDRPKMGFGIPLDEWLRGPLRDWAESLTSYKRLAEEGFLDAALVREKMEEHQRGHRNWQYHLWDVLMFQSWLEQKRSQVKTPSVVAVMA